MSIFQRAGSKRSWGIDREELRKRRAVFKMDSDRVTSNCGCSQEPSGGHRRVQQFIYSSVLQEEVNPYLQPGVKTGHYFPLQKDIILPVQFKKNLSWATKMLIYDSHYQHFYGFQLRWFITLKITAISSSSPDETKQNLYCKCLFSETSYPVGRDMCIWRKGQHAHHLPNLIQLSTFCLAEVLPCMSDGQRRT